MHHGGPSSFRRCLTRPHLLNQIIYCGELFWRHVFLVIMCLVVVHLRYRGALDTFPLALLQEHLLLNPLSASTISSLRRLTLNRFIFLLFQVIFGGSFMGIEIRGTKTSAARPEVCWRQWRGRGRLVILHKSVLGRIQN